jgi:hypothetical protein
MTESKKPEPEAAVASKPARPTLRLDLQRSTGAAPHG